MHRLVVVYRVPALDALDASSLAVRLERWRLGAEHAGWKFGWRDAPMAGDTGRRWVETYCYAFAAPDFLENEPEQLYWRTDIVQMTRYYMLEAARCGVRLSPRRAGFRLSIDPGSAGQEGFDKVEKRLRLFRRAASDRPPGCGQSALSGTAAGSPARARGADSRIARRR